MPLTPDAAEYLETSPLTADAAEVPLEEFQHWMTTADQLPENVRRALRSNETSVLIRDVTMKRHGLSLEQAQALAVIVRSVLFGELSASAVRTAVAQGLTVTPAVADDIARTINQRLITPNYFQIAQVYEKRRKGVGSREQGVGTGAPTSEVSAPTSEVGADAILAAPSPPLGKPRVPTSHVVDLRNGAIPSRLPPPPREAPRGGAELGPPPVTPSRPPTRAPEPPAPPVTPAPPAAPPPPRG